MGMTETQASEVLLKYMEDNNLDIDGFDGEGTERKKPEASPAEPSSGPPPKEEPGPTPSPEDGGDSAGDASQQDASPTTPQEGATSEVTSATLAGLLGVEEDAIAVDDESGAIFLRTKIDGTEGRATLPELLKGYQSERHNTFKSEQLEERRRTLDAEHAARMAQVDQAVGVAQKIYTSRKQDIEKEMSQIDWTGLEQQDPGRAALARQKFQEAIVAEDRRYQEAQQELSKVRQETFEHSMVENERHLRHHMPEMFDPDKSQNLRNSLATYLAAQGFSRQEIDQIVDHRVLRVVKDAMTLKDLQRKANLTRKKVQDLPKVTKPGAATTGRERAVEKRDAAMASHRKQGTEESMARGLLASGLIDALD